MKMFGLNIAERNRGRFVITGLLADQLSEPTQEVQDQIRELAIAQAVSCQRLRTILTD